MTNEKILYDMSEISSSTKTPKEINYMFVSLNDVEERAWTAIKELRKKQIIIEYLVVLDFFEQQEVIVRSLESMNGGYIQNILFMQGRRQEYEKNYGNIRARIGNNILGKIVGMDISCMPIPQFFLLLKWFARCDTNVIIYYTEPQKYIMNDGIFKSYFSMKGPVNVEEIKGYPGVSVKENEVERVLLCMLGFDNDLLPTVIQEAGPRKIVAINGFPSFYPKFKDISLANNEKILSGNAFANKLEKSKDLTKFIYVEADNPFDSYNTLQALKNQYGKNCIDIVPLGTKPMALGVCLFAIENEDIRVIFPFPEEYAEATGEKSKKTLEYVLNKIL